MRRYIGIFVILVQSSVWLGADEPAPSDLVGTLDASSSRIIVWKLGAKQYAVVQPAVLAIARLPDSDKLALGLTHSGYSAEDPDGKNVILTLTLQLTNVPAGADDAAIMAQKGLTVNPDLSVLNPDSWQLDISLPADAQEETRLRADLNLPRPIGEPGERQPLSLRWKNVPGARIYKWLTDPVNGLHIRYIGKDSDGADVAVQWNVKRSFSVSHDTLSDWWAMAAGNQSAYRWRGGIGPFAQSLIAQGAVSSDGQVLTLENGGAAYAMLSERVKSIASDVGAGVLKIDKTTFLSLAGIVQADPLTIESRIDADPKYLPGADLLTHPQYIKDLSGTSQGLMALKSDPDNG